MNIYHYFLLLRILKGNNWHVSWFYKDFIVVFFADTVQVRSWGFPIYIRFDYIDLVSSHRCVRITKKISVCIRMWVVYAFALLVGIWLCILLKHFNYLECLMIFCFYFDRWELVRKVHTMQFIKTSILKRW